MSAAAKMVGWVYGMSCVTSATMYIVTSKPCDVTLAKTTANAVAWPICAPYAFFTQTPLKRFFASDASHPRCPRGVAHSGASRLRDAQ